MSKQKEIEVKLFAADLKNVFLGPRKEMPIYHPSKEVTNEDKFEMVKAKLIIEIPEKSVTISESQFDEAWKEMHSSPMSDYDFLKEKLFNQEKGS